MPETNIYCELLSKSTARLSDASWDDMNIHPAVNHNKIAAHNETFQFHWDLKV
jgi:hypothetical protein